MTLTIQVKNSDDTKGGICSKCGVDKGGDYGMNGNGVQGKHVCKSNSMTLTEQILKEFDKKFSSIGKKPKDMPLKEWEEINHGWQVAQEFRKFLLDALTRTREECAKEVEEMLNKVQPLYTFGDVVIDSKRMQDGTILGQQKALIDAASKIREMK